MRHEYTPTCEYYFIFNLIYFRVCGTTGKRKACKDCSCGLREELDAGKEVNEYLSSLFLYPY